MNHYKTVEEALSFADEETGGIVIYRTKLGAVISSFGKLIQRDLYALVGYANASLAVSLLEQNGRFLSDPSDLEEEEGKEQ